jgi:hypothetical protein
MSLEEAISKARTASHHAGERTAPGTVPLRQRGNLHSLPQRRHGVRRPVRGVRSDRESQDGPGSR